MDGVGRQVDGAERVIAGVGHIQGCVHGDQPLRVAEPRLRTPAIDQRRLAVPIYFFNFPGKIGDKHTVVAAVADRQPVVKAMDLSGKPKRCLGFRLQGQGKVRAPQRPGPFPFFNQLLDKPVQPLPVALPRQHGRDIAFGVNDRKRRPGAHAVLTPHAKFRIVGHGMTDVVAVDGLAHMFAHLFVWELGGMKTDHDEAIGVFFFQVAQVRQDMHAVNATVGPEIQDHDPAPQVFHAERRRRIKPFQFPRQFRGADARHGIHGETQRIKVDGDSRNMHHPNRLSTCCNRPR